MDGDVLKLQKQDGGSWHVVSDSGKVLGKHKTKKEALAQAVAVKMSYEEKGKEVDIKTTSVRESYRDYGMNRPEREVAEALLSASDAMRQAADGVLKTLNDALDSVDYFMDEAYGALDSAEKIALGARRDEDFLDAVQDTVRTADPKRLWQEIRKVTFGINYIYDDLLEHLRYARKEAQDARDGMLEKAQVVQNKVIDG